MKNMDLKEETIKAYMEYLEGELLEDTSESIEMFISIQWYDLLDDIELHKEMFGIDQNEDDYESAKMIENMIREILINR